MRAWAVWEADPDRRRVGSERAKGFAWGYWSDVTHWDDPPAQFHLNGPFVSGSRGTTLQEDREPIQWRLRDVQAGGSYTIETELDGAILLCQWFFEALPDGRTNLRQRIGVAGPSAEQHAETIRQGFGPTLPEGMKRIAARLAEAEAAREGAG